MPAFTVPALLGITREGYIHFGYGTVTPSGRPFPESFSYAAPVLRCTSDAVRRGPTTPHQQRHQALTLARFSLYPFRSPLLRVSRLLSFPRGTEMFQFPRFPPTALCVQAAVTLHDECWVSPFGHLRIEA